MTSTTDIQLSKYKIVKTMALTREEEIRLAYGKWATSQPEVIDNGNSFIAGAKWADANPMNGWRSVKDELPKPNGEVLADIAITVGDSIFHEHAIAYLSKKDKGQWFTPDGKPVSVVNWMPLPRLPKID
jgi:hypothetical protein